MAVRAGYPALPLSVEDVEPEFHVVVRDGNRRGIRLERFFWTALKQFAQSRKSTLGQTVEEISLVAPETSNLTSAIRVACARWLAEENAELRKSTSLRSVNALLLASPSPAFALSSSKKILAFNPAFQILVRRQLPMELGDQGRHDLKLALDLNVADARLLDRRASVRAPVASSKQAIEDVEQSAGVRFGYQGENKVLRDTTDAR